jgi:hypothetical protein
MAVFCVHLAIDSPRPGQVWCGPSGQAALDRPLRTKSHPAGSFFFSQPGGPLVWASPLAFGLIDSNYRTYLIKYKKLQSSLPFSSCGRTYRRRVHYVAFPFCHLFLLTKSFILVFSRRFPFVFHANPPFFCQFVIKYVQDSSRCHRAEG